MVKSYSLTPTLDGTWQINAGVTAYTFNGNAAVYKQISPAGLTGSALTKGFVKIGDQAVRNLKKTNDLTWNCQVRSFSYNSNAPNVCTGCNQSRSLAKTVFLHVFYRVF
jgi:hypothetical protein